MVPRCAVLASKGRSRFPRLECVPSAVGAWCLVLGAWYAGLGLVARDAGLGASMAWRCCLGRPNAVEPCLGVARWNVPLVGRCLEWMGETLEMVDMSFPRRESLNAGMQKVPTKWPGPNARTSSGHCACVHGFNVCHVSGHVILVVANFGFECFQPFIVVVHRK